MPFMLTVDCPIPFLDLKPLERRLRHQLGVVDHDVNTTERLHGGVRKSFDLITADDIRSDRECLAPAAGSTRGLRSLRYCSSLNFSIQSMTLPSSAS